jgi:hypothetical protein
MVAVAVPAAMPIPGAVRENVFLPVSTKMIISVSQIVSILKIVCIPEIISIPELHSGVSLVPHAWGGGISVIRESREAIALETITLIRLSDGCRSEWTRAGERCSIWINRRLAKRSRPIRTHAK